MKIHSEVLSTLILSALVFALFAGCGGGDKATNNFTPLPSTGTPSDPDDGDGGEVATTGFYVSVNQDDDQPIETKIHAFNAFSTDCIIPTATTTPTDLKCLLNIRELDLYLNQTRLEVNLAPGMCKYLIEQPYWYYNDKAGDGPATLNVEVDSDLEQVTACSVAAGTGTEVGSISASGERCTVAEGYFNASGVFICGYDYKTDDPDKANCCMGAYTKTTATTSGGLTSVTKSSGRYGGKYGNCASGPAVRGMGTTKLGAPWPVDGRYGLPQNQFTYVSQVDGLNKYTDIPAGIDVNEAAWANVYSANMYGWTDYVAGTHSTASLPLAMSYDTDADGSSIRAPNPTYSFICSDNGRDVKHRIQVYVNEWDTNEKYDSYISSGGNTTYSPNVDAGDVEGVDCATTSSVPGSGYCDDFWDWDQISANTITFPEEYIEK